MVPKRQLKEGAGVTDSEHPIKRRLLLSTIFNGARDLHEYMPHFESRMRQWVKEEVNRVVDPFLGSSNCNNIECPTGSRTLQLQFDSKFPHRLFTGSRIISEDRSPVKIILYDSNSEKVVTSGPYSSIKVKINVLDGDFVHDQNQEEWSKKEFDRKIVVNRKGKRPLLNGELVVPLHDGVGYISDVSFTDNSSWIRSGRFRLGVKVHSGCEETSIREGISNAFKVKDHRGESYQKHHPPSLDDEVWRLEKIAKDGASHKRLTQFGISCIRDFLRLYVTNELSLRSVLGNVPSKKWETIIKHAETCTLDDKKYVYRSAQGTGLLFNSIYKVIGVTFDAHNFLSTDNLNVYQKRMVEDLKQHAYKNSNEIAIFDPIPITTYPMLFGNANFHVEQDQLGLQMNPIHSTISSTRSSFELGESSQMQGLSPTFTNSTNFGMSLDSPRGFFVEEHTNWEASGGNYYTESQLSTKELDFTVHNNFKEPKAKKKVVQTYGSGNIY
ncbi:hypothetical protein ACP275_02G098100 [Erythranthe tilingii]